MVLKVVFLWEVNQPFHHKQRGNVSSQFWRINSLTDLSTRFVYLVRSKVDEKHFREPGNIFHLIQSGGRGTQAGGEDREIDLLSRLHDLWDSTEFDWGQEQSRTAVCRNLSQAFTVTTFSHQSLRLPDLNIYVNQYPHTVNVYRFQYRGIPPMTKVLEIESCKHFLCLLQFTQPKCSGWWQNCWANQKLTALSQRPDMRWCMQGQGVFPRKSSKYNGFHQLDFFSDWWYLWVMTSRQVTLLESPSPSSHWKESGRLLVIHMNDGATWPDRVLNGTNQWFHLLPHKHRAINVVIRWENKLLE